MGLMFSSILDRLFGKKQFRICMFGLDAVGKTTILYKLKLGAVSVPISTIPTIGFNVETVKYNNINFTVWDVGLQKVIVPFWRHYYQDTDAVIFVVDSNDQERIGDAKEALHEMVTDDALRDSILLVFANKQDFPHAVSVAEVTEKLDLRSITNRKWHVQPSNAIQGEGLYEGLDWISKELAPLPN